VLDLAGVQEKSRSGSPARNEASVDYVLELVGAQRDFQRGSWRG